MWGTGGIVKCCEWAKQYVWWLGLSCQIGELVLKCIMWAKERVNTTEPLMPTKLPDRPWQKLGADLFTVKNANYLLLWTIFLGTIAQLTQTRCADVIVHLKSIFERHGIGIPETLITDNGCPNVSFCKRV